MSNEDTHMVLQLLEWKFSDQAIFKVFLFGSSEKNSLDIFVFTQETAPLGWFRVDLAGQPRIIQQQSLISLPSHVCPTSMALDDTTLIIGSRRGAMVIYDLNTDPSATTPLEPVLTVRHAHGKDAVTFVCILADEAGPSRAVLTVGRDGVFRRWTLSENEHCDFELTCIYSSIVSKGWLEKVTQCLW
jgi:hypothetical protein